MIATNRRALITGASSGIGRATAIAFAKAGIDLALVSRSQSKLDAVAAEVSQLGVAVNVYPCDLSAVETVEAQIGAIAADFGLDILVNSAGIGYTGDLRDTSLADWQQVMTINLTSVFQCIQAVLPGMRDRQQGTIINIASIAGYQAFPGWGAYNVSKAGLIALSKTLAAEERANGIRVVILNPGAVNTSLWDTETVHADFDRSRMLTPQTVAQSVLHAATLPSEAVIEELTVMPSAGAL
ncbi:SDR family oxidoreductase [Oculatella sp. LEGE 06141]|uniref:SDR family oxidoreductase n=1 Tax=Oculatella sp. LEGE 06141 TaxID=1828648 RepID=UPI0018805952|nr:SDR family oxidoreductase [Oculatella sp. LEGE 06141]MBE9179831.1 SDR family oxidoreductase [Oculatella sp. LEGE 06141]